MPDAVPTGTVRRILANLVKLVGGKAGGAVIGLAYMLVAARALGPRDYGVLVLIHGFAMTVGGIVEFPGWHAIVRYGSEALARDQRHRLVRLLRFAALVEGVGGACAVVTAAVLGPLLGTRLGWSPVAVAFAIPYSLAVLASIRATPAGYLQLMGRFDLLGIHNLIPPLIRLAGAGVALLLGAGLRGFLIAWLVAALAEWLAMWAMGLWVARQHLSGLVRDPAPATARQENPGLLRFMIAANAEVTLSELSDRLPALVIGWVLGPVAVGIYAVAQRATLVIAQPAQMLGRAAYAEFARLVAGGGRSGPLRRAVARCAGGAIAVAACGTAIIAVFGTQIAIALGGHGYEAAAGLMAVLAAARTILVIVPAESAALMALGRPDLSVKGNVLIGLGLLPLLPLLLGRLRLAGAGWFALLQAVAIAALLTWLLWLKTRPGPALAGAAVIA
jgi:O-antigen/teichoic acid export membrane protein